jgi:hypothetical protein
MVKRGASCVRPFATDRSGAAMDSESKTLGLESARGERGELDRAGIGRRKRRTRPPGELTAPRRWYRTPSDTPASVPGPRPLSALLAHCSACRLKSANRTVSARSAVVAGTVQYSPKETRRDPSELDREDSCRLQVGGVKALREPTLHASCRGGAEPDTRKQRKRLGAYCNRERPANRSLMNEAGLTIVVQRS